MVLSRLLDGREPSVGRVALLLALRVRVRVRVRVRLEP